MEEARPPGGEDADIDVVGRPPPPPRLASQETDAEVHAAAAAARAEAAAVSSRIIQREFDREIAMREDELAAIEARLARAEQYAKRLAQSWASRGDCLVAAAAPAADPADEADIVDVGDPLSVRFDLPAADGDLLRRSPAARVLPPGRPPSPAAAAARGPQEDGLAAAVAAAAAAAAARKRSRGASVGELGGPSPLSHSASSVDLYHAARERRRPTPLFARLDEASGDQFVQMVCPECRWAKFLGRTGFLKHCREVHARKFESFTHAASACGLRVAAVAVPRDDPSWSEPRVRLRRGGERLLGNIELAAPPVDAADATAAGPVSRFHIRKRVLLGNSSVYVPTSKREADDPSTFKWTVYVHSLPGDVELSEYVSKVRFFLHSSFKPNDVLDIYEEPFTLTRRGWGEFPIRVQLHFRDTSAKPVELLHQLSLDHEETGRCVRSEREVEVEFDRQWFESFHGAVAPPPPPPPLSLPERTLPLDAAVCLALLRYPRVGRTSDSAPLFLSYRPCASVGEWSKASLGRRLAVTWRRARNVQRCVMQFSGRTISLNEAEVLGEMDALGPVIRTPVQPPPCPFCGSPHPLESSASAQNSCRSSARVSINQYLTNGPAGPRLSNSSRVLLTRGATGATAPMLASVADALGALPLGMSPAEVMAAVMSELAVPGLGPSLDLWLDGALRPIAAIAPRLDQSARLGLLVLCRAFLRRLVHKALLVFLMQLRSDADAAGALKVLTPIHVVLALAMLPSDALDLSEYATSGALM